MFIYEEPPRGEVRFDFERKYSRRILRCTDCGHFLSAHDMDLSRLYQGVYVDSTYGSEGLGRAFDRIVALDPAKSDNVARVTRVVGFARRHFGEAGMGARRVLDVGSGLCVFLHRLKRETGWDCTALDPDPRAVAHARDRAAVKAVCADFSAYEVAQYYDVVTFNKVLEHVVDPVAMLRRAARYMRSGGFIYIELPDGEVAGRMGAQREEFFIDHWHIFSAQSVLILSQRAGFTVQSLERLHEPSDKYTVCAFLIMDAEGTARVSS